MRQSVLELTKEHEERRTDDGVRHGHDESRELAETAEQGHDDSRHHHNAPTAHLPITCMGILTNGSTVNSFLFVGHLISSILREGQSLNLRSQSTVDLS